MVSSELIEIIGPAFVIGMMIALTHAPLGVEVLKRGIIFIDLAVAQIAGLGMIAAHTLLHHPSAWSTQLIALLAAVLAGLFFRRIETTMPQQQEAIIGCSFVLAASLAILLLADHPHGNEEIKHLLSGQMLFTTWSDVAIHAPIYIFIVVAWFLRPSIRVRLWFYLLFALAITSSVQLVGVYVVFASLILPALAALDSKRPHLTAWSCGFLAVSLGIITATLLDQPAGPILVLCYVVTAFLFRVIKKPQGQN